MIFAEPITFCGPCGACDRHMDDTHAVSFNLSKDDDDDLEGEWICIRCARLLAKRLIRAADQSVKFKRARLVQRHRKWVPASKQTG